MRNVSRKHVPVQQASLPLDLFGRLQLVRSRYATALVAAGRGDYSQTQALRTVARYVGRALAREARKSPDERGGLRMLDICLAVDRFLPELRGWTQHEAVLRQRQRLSGGERAS